MHYIKLHFIYYNLINGKFKYTFYANLISLIILSLVFLNYYENVIHKKYIIYIFNIYVILIILI